MEMPQFDLSEVPDGTHAGAVSGATLTSKTVFLAVDRARKGEREQ